MFLLLVLPLLVFGVPAPAPQQPINWNELFGKLLGQSATKPSMLAPNPYGFLPYGNMPYNPYQQVPAQSQENFLWFCLEEIFPESARQQVGLPARTSEAIASIATHAFVLFGPTPTSSVAWHVQLHEGQRYWAKILIDAKKADVEHPTQWAKQYASQITGTTKLSSVHGASVYAQAKKCFRSNKASRCNNDQIKSFSSEYLKQHPRFNLAKENCVLYACNLFNHCTDGCDVGGCHERVSFEMLAKKDPQCNTLSTTPAKMLPTVSLPVKQVDDLSDFLPMHDPKALDIIKELMAVEDQHATAQIDLAHHA